MKTKSNTMLGKLFKISAFLTLALIVQLQLFGQLQNNIDFTRSNFPGKKAELKAAKKHLDAGNRDYNINKKGNDYKALDEFLKAYEFNPNNAKLNFMIGICYLRTDNKTHSLSYLEKAYKIDPQVDNDVKFELGQANQINLNFDEAIRLFKEYLNEISSQKRKHTEAEINKRIIECEEGKVQIASPKKIKVFNLSSAVNSIYNDYGPVFNIGSDILYFTSRRENTTGGQKDKTDNIYYEDIYYSKLVDGQWQNAINAGIPLNTSTNDAVVSISHDGKRMIVFRGNRGGGDLFESELVNGKWTEPAAFPKTINSNFRESSACLDTTNTILYFVSDRPGGYGGSDIYKSKRMNNGTWSMAENLGGTINSPYDEVSVSLASDNKTLYFSSKGHRTMGGADIFKSTYKDTAWSVPVNLGYPVNSPDDDVFYSLSGDSLVAFFSSSKEGGMGGQDIYKLIYLKDSVKVPVFFAFNGNVNDEDGKPLRVMIELSDDSTGTKFIAFSDSISGDFSFKAPAGRKYKINALASGFVTYSDYLEPQNNKDAKKIVLKKEPKAVKKALVFNNIYFDFDRFSLSPAAASELENIAGALKENSGVKIEISGHTDNKGSHSYNLMLSLNRAKSAYKYLLNKSINKSRMDYKGCSFDKPIAPNTNPDGTDNPEGRAKNRRDEFKILNEDKNP